jgi:excisionase family DNA binding protein
VSELSAAAIEAILAELAERIAAEVVRRLASEQGGSGEQGSPWMSVESAAVYLDWPKQRLYKLSASGAIPHYKQEGRLLFHRGELEAWLRRHAEGAR